MADVMSAKNVTKNNALMDEVNDARLLAAAVRRMEHFDPSTLIPADTVNRELGITEEDLADADEVELE